MGSKGGWVAPLKVVVVVCWCRNGCQVQGFYSAQYIYQSAYQGSVRVTKRVTVDFWNPVHIDFIWTSQWLLQWLESQQHDSEFWLFSSKSKSCINVPSWSVSSLLHAETHQTGGGSLSGVWHRGIWNSRRLTSQIFKLTCLEGYHTCIVRSKFF